MNQSKDYINQHDPILASKLATIRVHAANYTLINNTVFYFRESFRLKRIAERHGFIPRKMEIQALKESVNNILGTAYPLDLDNETQTVSELMEIEKKGRQFLNEKEVAEGELSKYIRSYPPPVDLQSYDRELYRLLKSYL